MAIDNRPNYLIRGEKIRDRLHNVDFHTKIEWWGKDETILTNEEVKKEPIVVRKALAIQHTLRNMPVKIKDHELIVGIPTMLSLALGKEFCEFALPEEVAEAKATSCVTVKQFGGIHPGNYEKLLQRGIKGLKADIYEAMDKEIRENAEPNQDKMELWRAMLISLDAVVDFAHRYSDLALREAAAEKDPVRAAELRRISVICSKVPENPPESFYEAVQGFWIFYMALHSCLEIVAVARTDQYLYPYYKADLDAGRITKDEAKDIVYSFIAKFGDRVQLDEDDWEFGHYGEDDESISGRDPDDKTFAFFQGQTKDDVLNYGLSINHWLMNMILSGVKPDGTDGTNDLTYMLLEAWDFMKLTSPVMSVRYHKDTPRELLEYCAEIQRSGRSEPVMYNDEVIIKGLVDNGIPLEDARQYTNDGCWEILIGGKCNFLYEQVHCLRLFEYVLQRGMNLAYNEREWEDLGDPEQYKTYEEFYQAYMGVVREMINKTVSNNIKHRLNRYKINPAVLLSTIVDDCVARGRDILNKGSRYTIYGLYASGVSNTVDSLAAVKKLVYEDKVITMTELVNALKANFEGYEPLRQMMLAVPKYGNNDPYVDEIMNRFLNDYDDIVRERNQWDDIKKYEAHYLLTSACATFEYYDLFGQDVGATPDGRLAKTSLSANASPSLGVDVSGPTASIKSACSPDRLRFFSGGPYDIVINPSELQGPEGINRMVGMMEAFREMGGVMLNLQCLTPELLRDAQAHPENHRDLRVHLGGLSAYFIQLCKHQQDVLIRRARG